MLDGDGLLYIINRDLAAGMLIVNDNPRLQRSLQGFNEKIRIFCNLLKSAVTVAYTCAESRCCKQPNYKHDDNTTVSTPVVVKVGRKVIKHIKYVRLGAVSHKVSACKRKLGVISCNLIIQTISEQAKVLFNVNSGVNVSYFGFRYKSITVNVIPPCKQARDLPRSINYHNIHFIDFLYDEQKVDVP